MTGLHGWLVVDKPVGPSSAAVVGKLKWALRHGAMFGGDPARLAVSGHSAGAHLAALLSYDRNYGVADNIKAAALLSGPFDFDPMGFSETRLALGV